MIRGEISAGQSKTPIVHSDRGFALENPEGLLHSSRRKPGIDLQPLSNASAGRWLASPKRSFSVDAARYVRRSFSFAGGVIGDSVTARLDAGGRLGAESAKSTTGAISKRKPVARITERGRERSDSIVRA